jgi:hypothetical protein
MAAMLVFRSLAFGFLATFIAGIVLGPRDFHPGSWPPRAAEPSHVFLEPPREPAPAIIDVAPGVTTTQLASAIRLAPGEHISAVDDAAVSGDVEAGLVLATRELRSRQFIDFTVIGPAGERRVLALLH